MVWLESEIFVCSVGGISFRVPEPRHLKTTEERDTGFVVLRKERQTDWVHIYLVCNERPPPSTLQKIREFALLAVSSE